MQNTPPDAPRAASKRRKRPQSHTERRTSVLFEELLELRAGQDRARENIVEEIIRLNRALGAPIIDHHDIGGKIERDDLEQSVDIGLAIAIPAYLQHLAEFVHKSEEAKRGNGKAPRRLLEFRSFARPRIEHEIKEYLQTTWDASASAQTKTDVHEIHKALPEWEEPEARNQLNPANISAILGISKSRAEDALAAMSTRTMASLDTIFDTASDEKPLPLELPDPVERWTSRINAQLLWARISPHLDEQDRHAVIERVGHERTFPAIARDLGISKQRVEQRVQRALRVSAEVDFTTRTPLAQRAAKQGIDRRSLARSLSSNAATNAYHKPSGGPKRS
ncbi:MAG: hypothetical protein HOQ05_06610 [Corynebacteriales bacterium]|nr:hypothetical protein [Mycobacteriales bacterium]